MSTTPPIAALPIEILQDIFILDSGANAYSLDGTGKAYHQLRLTVVCRAWRAAALSTHALWSRIHAFIYSSSKPVTLLRKRLATFLHHAGGGPLQVSLVLHPPGPVHQALLADLLTTSKRWRSLYLVTRTSSLYLLDRIFGQLGALERLHCVTIASGKAEEAWRGDTFHDTPRLKSFRLDRPQSISYAGRIADGPGEDADATLRDVACMSGLEHLTLNAARFAHGSNGRPTPIVTNSSVRTLDVECSVFLESLILPSLSSLVLRESRSLPATESCAFGAQALLARSRCLLRVLAIHKFSDVQIEAFRQLSAHLPLLARLELWMKVSLPRDTVVASICSLLLEGRMPVLEDLIIATEDTNLVMVRESGLERGVILSDENLRALSGMLATRAVVREVCGSFAECGLDNRVEHNLETVRGFTTEAFEQGEAWKSLVSAYHGQMNIFIRVSGFSLDECSDHRLIRGHVWLGCSREPPALDQ